MIDRSMESLIICQPTYSIHRAIGHPPHSSDWTSLDFSVHTYCLFPNADHLSHLIMGIIYIGLCFAQILTLIAYIVVTVGAGGVS